MARMKALALLCLVGVACTVAAGAQDLAPERFEPGRYVFTAPPSVQIEHRVESGVTDTHIEVRFGLYLQVMTYAWWSPYAVGVPASARESIEGRSHLGVTDFRVVEPPKETEFSGYPAWTLTRAYTIKARGGPGQIHVTETYLAIQRRWGYTVVSYTNDTEFFAQDRAKYEAFLASLRLLPEPPGNPIVLLAAVVAALVAAVVLGWRAWAKQEPGR